MRKNRRLFLGPTSLTPSSRLIPLEPEGLGTGDVECLTSYLTRLAKVHCVSIGRLIGHEIMPLCPNLLAPSMTNAGWTFNLGYRINGYGQASVAVAQALEQLTRRPNLRQLTMLYWFGFIAPTQVVRRYQAWCPDCWREWAEAGRPIYLPLQWTLVPVRVCLRHTAWLQQRCPYHDCGRKVPMICGGSRLGICPRCGRPLWNAVPEECGVQGRLGIGMPTSQELWIADVCGRLLSSIAPGAEHVDSVAVGRILAAGVQRAAKGRNKRFVRFVGINIRTLISWERGMGLPTLAHLLWFCWVTGVDPVQMLQTGGAAAVEGRPMPVRLADAPHLMERAPAAPAESDSEALLQRCLAKVLELTLASSSTPPASVAALARELDYSADRLRTRHPALCAAISRRYCEFRHQSALQTRRALADATALVCQALDQEGVYPSMQRIIERLRARGLQAHYRMAGILKARDDALRTLGWSYSPTFKRWTKA